MALIALAMTATACAQTTPMQVWFHVAHSDGTPVTGVYAIYVKHMKWIFIPEYTLVSGGVLTETGNGTAYLHPGQYVMKILSHDGKIYEESFNVVNSADITLIVSRASWLASSWPSILLGVGVALLIVTAFFISRPRRWR
ncbi:MAG: hypothetical protein QXY39_06910 [Thermofilaceae archaeon]